MENSRLVDRDGGMLFAPVGIGLSAPSLRLVEAIPMMGAWARAREVLFDSKGEVLGDPAGNAVGDPGMYVHRCVTAARVRNTRMLG